MTRYYSNKKLPPWAIALILICTSYMFGAITSILPDDSTLIVLTSVSSFLVAVAGVIIVIGKYFIPYMENKEQ